MAEPDDLSSWFPGLIEFLITAFGISLTGVLVPGPMTAATLAAGTRRRHAGALVALGHGTVELPLMILIIVGVGRVFEQDWVKVGIGLAGGAFLLAMGGQLLWTSRRNQPASEISHGRHPFWDGLILSLANPCFLLWWATVGLALASRAVAFGIHGFALFALIHWFCDLVWLEILSLATFQGSQLLAGRGPRIIPAVCGAAMLLFGAKFILDAWSLYV
jgi:threonine/homoserine/homoserine lactone efflux protein